MLNNTQKRESIDSLFSYKKYNQNQTIMLNIEDIKTMVKEETEKLNKIGFFPHKVSGIKLMKATSAYADIHVVTFELRVSEYYLSADPEEVRGTIMHELIHIIPGVKRGHGKDWKSIAAEVNKNYPQYSISRLGSQIKNSKGSFSLKVAANKTGFSKTIEVRCECCGRIFVRHRESNLTLHPEQYRCACGGHLHRV